MIELYIVLWFCIVYYFEPLAKHHPLLFVAGLAIHLLILGRMDEVADD